VFARTLVARVLGSAARSLDLVGDASIAWMGSTTIAADRIHALAFADELLGGPELAWGPIVAWQESARPLRLLSKGPDSDLAGEGRVLRAYPRSGRAVLVGAVKGELVGRSGVPLHFEAPRLSIELEPGARFAKPFRTSREGPAMGHERTDRALALLGSLKDCESSGGVRGRYKEKTLAADSLVYDGKTATFKGSPFVRVKDGEANMEVKTALVRVDLDEAAER
jgi:hypothetical protein